MFGNATLRLSPGADVSLQGCKVHLQTLPNKRVHRHLFFLQSIS